MTGELFELRLRHAQAQGELPAHTDPAALAGVAPALLHTLALRSRAGDSRVALRAIAEAGVRLICGEGAAASAEAAPDALSCSPGSSTPGSPCRPALSILT